jgi:hypothetical protein
MTFQAAASRKSTPTKVTVPCLRSASISSPLSL